MTAALHPRRLLMAVVILLMLAGAALTYQAKHQAAEAADHVADLRHQITQEQVAISMLKAEWGSLTQPGRLQALVERFPMALALGPFGIDQMVHIRDIPERPDTRPDLIADLLGGGRR